MAKCSLDQLTERIGHIFFEECQQKGLVSSSGDSFPDDVISVDSRLFEVYACYQEALSYNSEVVEIRVGRNEVPKLETEQRELGAELGSKQSDLENARNMYDDVKAVKDEKGMEYWNKRKKDLSSEISGIRTRLDELPDLIQEAQAERDQQIAAKQDVEGKRDLYYTHALSLAEELERDFPAQSGASLCTILQGSGFNRNETDEIGAYYDTGYVDGYVDAVKPGFDSGIRRLARREESARLALQREAAEIRARRIRLWKRGAVAAGAALLIWPALKIAGLVFEHGSSLPNKDPMYNNPSFGELNPGNSSRSSGGGRSGGPRRDISGGTGRDKDSGLNIVMDNWENSRLRRDLASKIPGLVAGITGDTVEAYPNHWLEALKGKHGKRDTFFLGFGDCIVPTKYATVALERFAIFRYEPEILEHQQEVALDALRKAEIAADSLHAENQRTFLQLCIANTEHKINEVDPSIVKWAKANGCGVYIACDKWSPFYTVFPIHPEWKGKQGPYNMVLGLDGIEYFIRAFLQEDDSAYLHRVNARICPEVLPDSGEVIKYSGDLNAESFHVEPAEFIKKYCNGYPEIAIRFYEGLKPRRDLHPDEILAEIRSKMNYFCGFPGRTTQRLTPQFRQAILGGNVRYKVFTRMMDVKPGDPGSGEPELRLHNFLLQDHRLNPSNFAAPK